MESKTEKAVDYMQCGPFKRAMEELSKNKRMSIRMAEKVIGLEADYTEQVDCGIRKLSLEDVIKIASFFGTTMDSVLDGGHKEIRVAQDEEDALAFRYFKECINTYVQVLRNKALDYRKPGLWSENVNAGKVDLERQEYLYIERHKTVMDEIERRDIQPIDAAGCCDEVLINELIKRGFKVERCEEDGKKANKSGR